MSALTDEVEISKSGVTIPGAEVSDLGQSVGKSKGFAAQIPELAGEVGWSHEPFGHDVPPQIAGPQRFEALQGLLPNPGPLHGPVDGMMRVLTRRKHENEETLTAGRRLLRIGPGRRDDIE